MRDGCTDCVCFQGLVVVAFWVVAPRSGAIDPERTLTGKREGPPDERCVSLSEVVSVASSGVRYAAIWSEPY